MLYQISDISYVQLQTAPGTFGNNPYAAPGVQVNILHYTILYYTVVVLTASKYNESLKFKTTSLNIVFML